MNNEESTYINEIFKVLNFQKQRINNILIKNRKKYYSNIP
jgi:hypothetical protein